MPVRITISDAITTNAPIITATRAETVQILRNGLDLAGDFKTGPTLVDAICAALTDALDTIDCSTDQEAAWRR